MQHQELSTAHEVAHAMLDNPEYILYGIGVIGGSIWWVLHRIFSTREHTAQCKRDVLDTLDRHEHDEVLRADQRQLADAEQHALIREDNRSIKADVRQILDHILGNGK